MKQVRPATQPVIYLWLLEAKFSYFKSMLGSEEGKKLRADERLQLVLELMMEFEGAYENLPQEKVNVWHAKMCDVLSQLGNIVIAI